MRKLLLAAAAIGLAAPAAAQPPAYAPPADAEALHALPGPSEIAEIGGTIDRLIGVFLDVPIGGLVAAVDPLGRSPYRGVDRLRDLSDDPHIEHRLRDTAHATTHAMAALVASMAVLTPALQRTIEDVQHRVDEALRREPVRD